MKSCFLITLFLFGYVLGSDDMRKCPPKHPSALSTPPNGALPSGSPPPHSTPVPESSGMPAPKKCRTHADCSKEKMEVCCPHLNHSICVKYHDDGKDYDKDDHKEDFLHKHLVGVIIGLVVLLAAILVVGIGGGVYFWRRYKRNQMNKRECRATIAEANASSDFKPAFSTSADYSFKPMEEKPPVV